MTDKSSGEWMRGSLDLMILSVLAEDSLYGYLIQQQLDQVSGGRVQVQEGTLYPVLHRLEAAKLVRARWDDSAGRRRKWYDITAAGRKRLTHQAVQWNEYAEILSQLLEPALKAAANPA